MTALEVMPTAIRARRGASLAALILETIRAAFQQLAEQVATQVGDLVPDSIERAELQHSLAGRLPDLRSADEDEPEVEEVPEPDLPVEWAARGTTAEQAAAAAQTWEAFDAETRRLSGGYLEVAERFATAESTGRSPGGEVEVTVRAGDVVGLTISDAALQHDSGPLAEQVLAALQQAQAELASQLAECAQTLTGPALDVHDLVGRYQPSEEERR